MQLHTDYMASNSAIPQQADKPDQARDRPTTKAGNFGLDDAGGPLTRLVRLAGCVVSSATFLIAPRRVSHHDRARDWAIVVAQLSRSHSAGASPRPARRGAARPPAALTNAGCSPGLMESTARPDQS